MTIEELLVFGKSHCHSDHAKILLAELLQKNPLELLICLDETVTEEKVNTYKNISTRRRQTITICNWSCKFLRE